MEYEGLSAECLLLLHPSSPGRSMQLRLQCCQRVENVSEVKELEVAAS